MIKLININFGFNKVILKDVNLTLESRNQIIGVLGPNGAGKTTLLNVLAGYYQKYAGDLETDKTFLLPDTEYIPEDLMIKKCIRMFPHLYRNFNVTRAEQMVDFLHLDRNKRFKEFSKGMKEQTHILLALAQDVDTYLFDEPLAAVDPYNRKILLNLIEKFRRKDSKVLISTHLIEDIHSVFDEVIFIRDGRILLYEPVAKIMENCHGSLEEKYLEVMGNENSLNRSI